MAKLVPKAKAKPKDTKKPAPAAPSGKSGSKVKANFRGAKPGGSTRKVITVGKTGVVKRGKEIKVGKGTTRNASTGGPG
jgi:hypothetical protein